MIARAIELRPDDGYIVDSLGWVYYMRAQPLVRAGPPAGRAEAPGRARSRSSSARTELTGGDPVISEHLGDTYLLLDQKRQALDRFEEAIRLEPRESEQPELMKKFENLKRELAVAVRRAALPRPAAAARGGRLSQRDDAPAAARGRPAPAALLARLAGERGRAACAARQRAARGRRRGPGRARAARSWWSSVRRACASRCRACSRRPSRCSSPTARATSCSAPRTARSNRARCTPDLLWQVASLDLTPEEAIELVLGAPAAGCVARAACALPRPRTARSSVELGDASGRVRERRSFDAQGRLRGVERLGAGRRAELVGALRRSTSRWAASPSRTRSGCEAAAPLRARRAGAFRRRAESGPPADIFRLQPAGSGPRAGGMGG